MSVSWYVSCRKQVCAGEVRSLAPASPKPTLTAWKMLLLAASLLPASPALAEPGADALKEGTQAANDCDVVLYKKNEAILQNLAMHSRQHENYRAMLDNLPRLSNKCPPKHAAKKNGYHPGAKLKIAEDSDVNPPPRAPLYFSANYFYVAGAVGGANTCTNQSFTQITTLGGPDAFDPSKRSDCDSAFLYGGAFGGLVSTPFTSPFFNAPVQVGAEVQALGASGGSNTFQGTPTTALGALPGTDSYKTQDNYFVILNATAMMPVTSGVSVFGQVGYGWANKTVTYNCVGLCTLAGQPQSSTSKDVTLGGAAVGGGVQFDVPNASFPVRFQAGFEHVFLDGKKSVSFGTPATVLTNFNVGQSVDLFTARVVVPLATSGR